MNKQQVFQALRERGAAKAVVKFSGGNDEGGCEGIEFYDQLGNPAGEMEEHWGDSEWDPVKQKYVEKPLTKEQKLSKALCAPVYDKYYSFAGDFYVYGQVVWDVSAGKVTMDGTEEVAHGESFEEEL